MLAVEGRLFQHLTKARGTRGQRRRVIIRLLIFSGFGPTDRQPLVERLDFAR